MILLLQGKDHTIHASVPGYVTYYRDSALNAKRTFSGSEAVIESKRLRMLEPTRAGSWISPSQDSACPDSQV